MTSEMEAAFEAVHRPSNSDELVATILAELGERSFGPESPEHPGHALWLQNNAIRQLEEHVGVQGGKLSELHTELEELRRKPPKPPRTGAGARMNPDDIRVARGVLVGTALFGVAAFIVSFGGQLAMAPYTRLQPELYWFVPFVIEAPIILLSFMIAVFRRRKQHTALPWIMMLALTATSSAINALHVWIESGGLPEPGDVAGAAIMGLAPWLVLLLFEEFVRLSVRPTVEHHETPATASAARKPSPNRKGTKK